MESLAHVLHSARELVTRKLQSTGKATNMVNLMYVTTANQGHDLIKLRILGSAHHYNYTLIILLILSCLYIAIVTMCVKRPTKMISQYYRE